MEQRKKYSQNIKQDKIQFKKEKDFIDNFSSKNIINQKENPIYKNTFVEKFNKGELNYYLIGDVLLNYMLKHNYINKLSSCEFKDITVNGPFQTLNREEIKVNNVNYFCVSNICKQNIKGESRGEEENSEIGDIEEREERKEIEGTEEDNIDDINKEGEKKENESDSYSKINYIV